MKFSLSAKSTIFKNLVTYSLADLAAKSILLIISPILTRILTPTQFGVFALFTALWGFISVIQYGGVDASYQFFRAQTQDENERSKIQVTSTYLVFFSFFILWLIFSIICLSTNYALDYLKIDRWQMFLFLIGLIPGFITLWAVYIFRFMHLARPFVTINLLSRVVTNCLAIPFIAYAAISERLFVFTAMIFVFQTLSLIWVFREIKAYNIPFLNRDLFSSELGKKLFVFGVKFIPSTLIYSLAFHLDRLLVGYYLPADQVAKIGLAIQFSAAVLMLKTWFSLLWDPHLVEWISTKNPSYYLPKLNKAVVLICLVFFSVTALTKVWGDVVIDFIYPDFFSSIAELLPIIALATTFSVLSLVAIATLFIANTTKFRNTVFGGSLIINFSFAVIFIPSLGVKGAVIASLAGEAFILLAWIIIGKYILKNLQINWSFSILLGGVTFVFVQYFSFGLLFDPIFEKIAISIFIISFNFYLLFKSSIYQTFGINFKGL